MLEGRGIPIEEVEERKGFIYVRPRGETLSAPRETLTFVGMHIDFRPRKRRYPYGTNLIYELSKFSSSAGSSCTYVALSGCV